MKEGALALCLTHQSTPTRTWNHTYLNSKPTGMMRSSLHIRGFSFTAFIIACLGKAIDEHKAVQAFRKGSNHLILFADVDVLTYIERDVAGQKQIMPYIIRAANRKTFRGIHQEIRAAQREDVEKAVKWLQFFPDLLFRPFFWVFSVIGREYPQVWKTIVGTVGITAVGMFGKGAGWGIPITGQTTITVGGIGEKPGVVDGQITMREYLSLTISFDHETIDGAPAARFTQRLKELIESGYGLDDSTVASELVGVEDAAMQQVEATRTALP